MSEGIPRATKAERQAYYTEKLSAYQRVASGISSVLRIEIRKVDTNKFISSHESFIDPEITEDTLDPKFIYSEDILGELDAVQTVNILGADAIAPEIEVIKEKLERLAS